MNISHLVTLVVSLASYHSSVRFLFALSLSSSRLMIMIAITLGVHFNHNTTANQSLCYSIHVQRVFLFHSVLFCSLYFVHKKR